LLVDPLPINKVSSLIIQEERQRQIISSVGSLNLNNAAMLTTASHIQFQGSKLSTTSQSQSQGYKPVFCDVPHRLRMMMCLYV
jgi:hypothetical protein